MRKSAFACTKMKVQISCAVIAQLISAFVFSTSLYFLIPKFQASGIFCSGKAQFVLNLVKNTEDRITHDAAQISPLKHNKVVGTYQKHH